MIFHQPLLARCIIDGPLALLPKFFQLVIAQDIDDISAQIGEQDFLLHMGPLSLATSIYHKSAFLLCRRNLCQYSPVVVYCHA
jgi:hypothetical protein